MKLNKKGYPVNWRNIAVSIKVRDNYKCQICGAREGSVKSKNGKLLSFHVSHKNHIKTDCRENNLWCLCPAHHRLYDSCFNIPDKIKKKAPQYISDLNVQPIKL